MLSENNQKTTQKRDLKPNKLLGQNFLTDHSVLKKIIRAADLSPDDTVLEVGPGKGILTLALAARAQRVIAVEKDQRMVEYLKVVLKEKNITNTEIIEEDILKILTHECHSGESQNPDHKKSGCRVKPGMTNNNIPSLNNYKVVANIPYYLTSHLIRVFLEAKNPPSLMVLMVQKEVAQRLSARPPQMSLLAVATQFYADVKIIATVPKKSFRPMPKIDSAIIKITPTNNTNTRKCPNDINRFFQIIRTGFSQPRKQLINNLSRGLKIDRQSIMAALKKIGLQPEQRAETLSVDDWIKLLDTI